MSRRLRAVGLSCAAMLLVGGVLAVPTLGWLWLAPGAAAAAVSTFVTLRAASFRRPELALLGQWVAVEILVGASVALADGPREYLLIVLAVPAVFCSIILPARAMWPFLVFVLGTIVAVALGFDLAAVRSTLPVLWVPTISAIVLAMTGSALSSVDAESRNIAIVDGLTGVFNRMALIPRAAEVTHQAAATGNPVAVIVGDVDGFKAINDQLGHAAGDTVLKEVAARLARRMGAFEPVYRFGGEEFVVLLAGSELAAALQTAEHLRETIETAPILGVTVTMSFGVAASVPGEQFEFVDIFSRADNALYDAKRSGRNQVKAHRLGPVAIEHHPADRRKPTLDGPSGRDAGRASQPWRERLARERETTGNWLVRDQVEREHMLAVNTLLGKNFRRTALTTFLALVISAPWFGWAMLAPPVLAGVFYNVIQIRLSRLRRPEYALACGWLVMQLGTAAGFLLAHRSPLFALPLFALMVIGSAGVFPRRAVILGTAATALLLVASALAIGAHEVRSTPAILIFPLVLLGTVSLAGAATGRSAIHYRGAAVIDELTGMLTRNALRARAAELAHHTAVTGEQVAVILADLDHFKSINDQHGHAQGDAVLREVAYRIRKHLRAFESVYRLGGEEFAVLLTGADGDEATRVAHRLWAAINAEPVDGLVVTMSCGVAVTEPGEVFDHQAVFARADGALYAAKHGGRDCVRVDAPSELALAA